MKRNLKNAMYAMLAAGMFASCTTTEDITSEVPVTGGDDGVLGLKIAYQGSATTYATEGGLSAGPNTSMQDAHLFLLDASGNVVKYYHVSDSTAFQTTLASAPGMHFRNAPASTTEALFVSNVENTVTASELGVFQGLTTKAAIQNFKFRIERQQKGQGTLITTGVPGVTMMGAGPATAATDPIHGAGVSYKEANFTIKPIVARMEFQAQLIPTNGLATIQVDSIYLNNFWEYNIDHANAGTPPDTLYRKGEQYGGWTGAIESAWPDSMKNDSSDPFNAASPANAEAFQFFADTSDVNAPTITATADQLPHILIKVHGTKTDATPISGWITISKYFNGGTTTSLTHMEANTIYKIGGTINIAASDITPNPEPELVHLGVIVTVVPWSVVNIDPDL